MGGSCVGSQKQGNSCGVPQRVCKFWMTSPTLYVAPMTVQEVDVEDESVKKAAIDGKSTAVMTIMTDGTLDRNVKIIIVALPDPGLPLALEGTEMQLSIEAL